MTIALFLSILGSWVSLGGDSYSAPEITLVEADMDHVVIQLNLSGYSLETISEYSRFDVAEYDWDMDAPIGDPELPLIPVVIGIPAGLEASVTMQDSEWISAGDGKPYPVQPILMDCETSPLVFAELSSQLQGVYPTQPLNLDKQGKWAGVNTIVLQISPFSWDETSGEFQVASSITARVDFLGTRTYQTSVRPEIANMHGSMIINYDELDIMVDSSPVTMDDDVYLCVVPPENLESVTPLLAMVNSLGHHVNVIEIEPGLNSYQVALAIKDVYQEGITRFALIPARHQQLESKNYGSFYGDFYYAQMTSDNLPDIAVGRYPGNFTQLENQTGKTMSYISYTGEEGQPSIPTSVILAAHQEDYPGKYTANSEAVRTWDYELADIDFETAYAGEGGNAADISAAINTGVGIVNYRGHGSVTIWQWTGGWNAGDVYALVNTYMPPVFNVCCSNGTHDLSYNCLGETWMDAPNGVGASGNLAASAPSATVANNRMQKVLFWQLFDTGNTCAGEMLAATQVDLIQTQGAPGLGNAKMYHWFGDPSMDIQTGDADGTPFAMDFSVPEALNIGANTLQLTITSNGSPLEGAVVTITDGVGNHPDFPESFYEQQITNSSGQVWLNFTALEDKNLYYGVRKHNYASATGTIDVVSTGIETGQSYTTNLLPITPSPVNGLAQISFTSPSSDQVNISVLDLSGRVVSTIHDGAVLEGAGFRTFETSELSPGIYFVMMHTAHTTITRKMAVVR